MPFHAGQSHFYAVLMMPLSLCFVVYAVRTYLWRSDKINTRDVERCGTAKLRTALVFSDIVQGSFVLCPKQRSRCVLCRWDDPFGPLILTFLLILAMVVQFYFKVIYVLT